jgi:hypothetical protein
MAEFAFDRTVEATGGGMFKLNADANIRLMGVHVSEVDRRESVTSGTALGLFIRAEHYTSTWPAR